MIYNSFLISVKFWPQFRIRSHNLIHYLVLANHAHDVLIDLIKTSQWFAKTTGTKSYFVAKEFIIFFPHMSCSGLHAL